MSFPVTINASVRGVEQPGKFSTFLNGTDRYQVQLAVVGDIADGNWQLVVYKSTDTGATWSAVDASNGPLIFADTFAEHITIPYSCVQISSTVLKIFYPDASDGPSMTTFTMGGSPAWSGAHTVAPTPPIGGQGISGEGNFQLPQVAMGYRALDNSIVVVVVGDQTVSNDVVHSICSFNVYDVTGDSWGSWADLDFVDYSDITTWDLIPCGIAIDASSGRATVFMQQVSRDGPGSLISNFITSTTFLGIPLDADGPTGFGKAAGPGGGGGGDTGVGRGGGGGGGEYRGGALTLTPGGTLSVTIGTGGPVRTNGSGPTVVGSISANPGHAGVDAGGGGAGGTGGSGGSEHNDGGNGGASGSQTGGGGGGPGGPAGPGQAGSVGGSLLGGSGGNAGDPNFPTGTGQCVGGAGGNVNDTNPPGNGQPGGGSGSGGGGQGGSSLTPNAGTGTDGEALVTWTSVRNTHACRMFQQAIKADNSLGTLTEITQGAFPSRSKGGAPVPISFDCAAQGGKVWFAFTGASSTTDRDNISVGSGATADVVSFSFQTFTSGNGSNNVDSSPAIALGSGVAYCCYISSPDAGPAAFLFRADNGSGFGGTASLGTLTLPDIREFSRLQASVLATLPEVTFGRPTTAVHVIVAPG